MNPDVTTLDFKKTQGLLPAIVQDAQSGRVLMLAYMNEAAYRATCECGLATFYSRSKQRLWQKGETSGNTLRVCRIEHDCDADALLVFVEPAGPACHRGTKSCFDKVDEETQPNEPLQILRVLEQTIQERSASASRNSYTRQLLDTGTGAIAQKVGEESVEVVIAALSQSNERLAEEAADLLYHLLVLLESKGSSLTAVLQVLEQRHTKSAKTTK